MKKKKLYKLIKEQLKVTLLEELFKKRTKKRNAKLWDKKWNNFINEQKIIKKQRDKEFTLKIARFLKESKKSKILLEEIIENPLLNNINKKKLPKLYKSLNSLSFSKLVEQIGSEEFQVPEIIWGGDGNGIVWSGCNMTQTDFGVATIYEDGNCNTTPHTINDSFVCCSDNNAYSPSYSGYGPIAAFQFGTNQAFGGIAANNMGAMTNKLDPASSVCYCPNPVVDANDDLTSCFTNTTTYNITVADFDTWLQSLPLANPPDLSQFGANNGVGCAGCAHMANPTVPGTTPYYGLNPWDLSTQGGTGGCPTDGSNLAGGVGQAGWNGQMDPDNLSCCAFYGCDQSLASPAPTNLATFTLTAGTLGTITANATDPWFFDNSPGAPCIFNGCPGFSTSFTLGGSTYTYSTNLTTISGITNTNNSYTVTNDGSCVMNACSDINITTVTDPQGNTLNNNYIANPTNAPIPYTVTNDVNECVIEACNTAGSLNTVDTTQTGWNSAWTIVDTTPSLCVAIVTGCTDSTQGAPDYTDINGNCPDGTTGTAGQAGACAGATGGGYVAQNYDPAANQDTTPTSCTYAAATINGCTNTSANNYFCDTNAATGTYACTGTNFDVLPVDVGTGAQLVVDTSPTMCTFDAGCVDDGNAPNSYTHNQSLATSPATLPSVTYGSPYGGNVMNLNTVEPATNFDATALLGGYGNGDGSCTYNPGCTDNSFIEYYNTTPPAIHDDGTCDELIITGSGGNLGCMLGQILGAQGLNTNYNSNAIADNGGCDIEACDDINADNYVCTLVDSIPLADYCTGGATGTINVVLTSSLSNPGNIPVNPLSVNSFTPAGTFDPNTNNKPLACKYTVIGCTIPGAQNYDATANVDDGSCYFEYCPDNTTPAFNYTVNQPTSQYAPTTMSFSSNPNNIATPELCEYIGCSTETIGSAPILNALTGSLGQDDGYNIGNNGCISGSGVGATQIPSTQAVGWQTTGLLDPLNTDCCEFAGCYNAGNPTYNQVVGGTTTTAVPVGYDPNSSVDNGTCKYFGCTDPQASNYFCIANPDVCGGNQGGPVDPAIGTVADDGTCEYNHCADVQAVKCGNPFTQGPGQQIVYDFDCMTIGGTLPALGTNDRFLVANPPPILYPDPDGPIIGEQSQFKLDIPDPGSTCHEVVSITPSSTGNQTDYPSCVCPDPVLPSTYDCCTYATCPGTFQLHYGPGSPWALANPGMSTPSVDPNAKFCQERTDGTGQFPTLNDCNLSCDEEPYNCTCCRTDSGQPESPLQQVTQAGGGCPTLNSTIYSHCQPAINPGNLPSIIDVCAEAYEDIYGCTDPAASNYNQYATIDDGSCEYEGADCQCCVLQANYITLSPITINTWCLGYAGYPMAQPGAGPCPYQLGDVVQSETWVHQDFNNTNNNDCSQHNSPPSSASPLPIGYVKNCTTHPSQPGGWTWSCNDIITGSPLVRPSDVSTNDEEVVDIDNIEPIDLNEPTTPTSDNDLRNNPDDLKESKKLRKLIEKWRKNNL